MERLPCAPSPAAPRQVQPDEVREVGAQRHQALVSECQAVAQAQVEVRQQRERLARQLQACAGR